MGWPSPGARSDEHQEQPPRPGHTLAVDFHDWEGDEDGKDQMLVTDRDSGLIWDYYLRNRSATEIIQALEDLFKILDRQHHLKVAVVQCDNEIITTKPAIATWIEDQGIKVEPSAPYTQAQNGGAERSGGVIKEKARAMRASSKLPGFLWKEICKAAVYLYNRTPRYQNNWKSPYELFHTYVAFQNGIDIQPRKPQNGHLRVFGCKAFVPTTDALLKRNRMRKLDPRNWIGYLVGYNSTNIYRIWNPRTNKIIRTRDVVFDEDQIFSGSITDLADDLLKISRDDLARLIQQIDLPLPQQGSQEASTEDSTWAEVPEGQRQPRGMGASVELSSRPSQLGQLQPVDEQRAEIPHDLTHTGQLPADGPGTGPGEHHLEERAGRGNASPRAEKTVLAYPTPSISPPPGAFLAQAIESPGPSLDRSGKWPEKPSIYNVWKAAFAAGSESGPYVELARAGQRAVPISKASFRRELDIRVRKARQIPRKEAESKAPLYFYPLKGPVATLYTSREIYPPTAAASTSLV